MNRNYDVINFISKYFCFKKPRVASFADIVKVATMVIKTTFNKKVKELDTMYQKTVYLYSLIYITKVAYLQ